MKQITLTPQTPREEQMLLALHKAMTPAEPDAEPATDVQDLKPDERRQQVRRMVGVLAVQLARAHTEVYVWAYHEFYKRTGYHPVVASKAVGAHLDAALRYAGGADILLDILATRLQTDATPESQFAPGRHELTPQTT